jgi:hypothetical protein
MTVLAKRFPTGLSDLSDEGVAQTLAKASKLPDGQAKRFALADALFAGGWTPQDPFTDLSGMRMPYVQDLIRNGRLDDAKAPTFARTIDIHRKPGYDPLELHLDRTRLPQIAIPLDVSLVKGSHGAVDPANPHETIFIASRPDVTDATALAMTDVAGIVERMCGAWSQT